MDRVTSLALATLVTVVVSLSTKIGPTVLDLGAGHGVHAGDLLVLAACAAYARRGAGDQNCDRMSPSRMSASLTSTSSRSRYR